MLDGLKFFWLSPHVDNNPCVLIHYGNPWDNNHCCFFWGLVNVNKKTMERSHHFSWENSRFLVIFAKRKGAPSGFFVVFWGLLDPSHIDEPMVFCQESMLGLWSPES